MPDLRLAPVVALALISLACASARAGYQTVPRGIAQAVRRDHPGCPGGDLGGIEVGDFRYEVRACGVVAVYACPYGFGGECSAASGAPGATAAPAAGAPDANAAHADAVEQAVADFDASPLEGPVALTVVGAIVNAGASIPLFLAGIIELFDNRPGVSGLRPGTEPFLIAGLVAAGVGAITFVPGVVWLTSNGVRRRGAALRITEHCTAISPMLGSVTGVAASLCFP
jgi:hypothetical protein